MTEKSDDENSDFYLPEDDPAITLGNNNPESYRGPRIKILAKGNEQVREVYGVDKIAPLDQDTPQKEQMA